MKTIEQYDHLISIKDEEGPINVPLKLCPQFEDSLLQILHMLGR